MQARPVRLEGDRACPTHSSPSPGTESRDWSPIVSSDACIGCGTCVTGCSRLVYRYDFENRKAVVADPLNCMVGCTTCANTCPTQAISFPPLASVFALAARPEVRHAIEDDLIARKEDLARRGVLPHADRVVRLQVVNMDRSAPDILILTLQPQSPADALRQFMPGQYLELVAPGASWLPRAYSIGNAPRDDGSVEVQVRRVVGGRMTEWLFEGLHFGSTVEARGPLGRFPIHSEPDTPLVFVGGGTGFAPIKAMMEQQLTLDPHRDMVLFWERPRARNSTRLRRSLTGANVTTGSPASLPSNAARCKECRPSESTWSKDWSLKRSSGQARS